MYNNLQQHLKTSKLLSYVHANYYYKADSPINLQLIFFSGIFPLMRICKSLENLLSWVGMKRIGIRTYDLGFRVNVLCRTTNGKAGSLTNKDTYIFVTS